MGRVLGFLLQNAFFPALSRAEKNAFIEAKRFVHLIVHSWKREVDGFEENNLDVFRCAGIAGRVVGSFRVRGRFDNRFWSQGKIVVGRWSWTGRQFRG
ncbi:MAG: hypothetical protein V1847_01390, partial [Candidatus Diapherotrites archaeon]